MPDLYKKNKKNKNLKNKKIKKYTDSGFIYRKEFTLFMSCYSPLRAVILGYKPDGKKILKIIPESKFKNLDTGKEYINIPCGKCIGCRLDYSRMWADRCIAEASYHKNNIFLTLTYDDDHLPEPNTYVLDSQAIQQLNDPEDNCVRVSPVHPLVKRDLQLFIKRLRKKFPDQKIRYFACGEYGGKNMRPHYHLIIFGLRLDDCSLLYKNEQSYRYYTSDSISDLWKFGFHIITSVNWDTCAYVARYIMKKQKGEGAEIYEDLNFTPEFTIMSRKPGIGRQFYEDHKLKLYDDDFYLPTEKGAHKIKPNKYYDSLFDVEYPDYMYTIREDRKQTALVNEALKDSLTDKSFSDRLKAEEDQRRARIKILQRKEL